MKRQHRAAVARGAFGKHRQHLVSPQALGHVVHHPQGVAARFAGDVERAPGRGQGADQRPMLDVGFGNKAAVPGGVHDQDVKPRNMVGRQQHRPTLRHLAVHLQFDAQAGQHGVRPGLHRRVTRVLL